MAQLKQIVPPQQFELIRDRIAMIVAEEFTQQLYLGVTGIDPSFKVFVERFSQPNVSEFPIINVSLLHGEYDNQDARSDDGTYFFAVDAYTVSKTKADGFPGDTSAAMKLQRMLGIIRAIFRNPNYRTLLFPAPSISSIRVSKIDIAQPKDDHNSLNVMQGRVTLKIRVPENAELGTTIIPSMLFSTWVIADSGKGYQVIQY